MKAPSTARAQDRLHQREAAIVADRFAATIATLLIPPFIPDSSPQDAELLELCDCVLKAAAAFDTNTARAAERVIGRIPAATPAGIFAKALVIERLDAPMPDLARSLARDLRTSPGLRALIWPGDLVAAAAAPDGAA